MVKNTTFGTSVGRLNIFCINRMDVLNALLALRPGSGWGVSNNDYDTIINYSNVDMPTREEVYEWIDAQKSMLPMKLLRELRNKLLAECDWMVVKAYSRNERISENLSIYLQQLRDLPATATPTLNERNELDMSSFTLPVLVGNS